MCACVIKQIQCRVFMQDQPTPKKQKLNEAAALPPVLRPLQVVVLVRHSDYTQEGNQGLTACAGYQFHLGGGGHLPPLDFSNNHCVDQMYYAILIVQLYSNSSRFPIPYTNNVT